MSGSLYLVPHQMGRGGVDCPTEPPLGREVGDLPRGWDARWSDLHCPRCNFILIRLRRVRWVQRGMLKG